MPQKVYIFSFKLLELSMWRGTLGRANPLYRGLIFKDKFWELAWFTFAVQCVIGKQFVIFTIPFNWIAMTSLKPASDIQSVITNGLPL
jgi:ABC-type glycerol-3-phosphate transport system permease component